MPFLEHDVIFTLGQGIKWGQRPIQAIRAHYNVLIKALAMAITYPRPCPTCGKKYKNRFDFCRHKKYCESKVKVPCLHRNKLFSRKDKMTAHFRKFHSEAAKRKAEESAELLKLEILNSNKVPRLSVEHQSGGAVTTRGMKRVSEETSPDVKAAKPEDVDSTPTTSEAYGGGTDPLFQANIENMGKPKNRKKEKSLIGSLPLPWGNPVKQHQTRI